jgi:hypothetical protein
LCHHWQHCKHLCERSAKFETSQKCFFMLSVIQTFSHLLPWPQWSVMKHLNSCFSLQGGGMLITGSSTVTVTTCTISGNSATAVNRFPKILEPLRNSPSPQWSYHVWNLIGACLVWQGCVSNGNESNLLKPSSIAPMECCFMCSKSEL